MEIVLNFARTPRQKGLQGWFYADVLPYFRGGADLPDVLVHMM